jgi:hypothetical protein
LSISQKVWSDDNDAVVKTSRRAASRGNSHQRKGNFVDQETAAQEEQLEQLPITLTEEELGKVGGARSLSDDVVM